MSWRVDFHPDFLAEYEAFSRAVQDELLALVGLLQLRGAQLGRPHADTLKGSAYANMKELRFKVDNGVWRVAFAFDPERKGVLLVAGNKSGIKEGKFYKVLIKRADERYTQHLRSLRK
jgi:hypothetical protein